MSAGGVDHKECCNCRPRLEAELDQIQKRYEVVATALKPFTEYWESIEEMEKQGADPSKMGLSTEGDCYEAEVYFEEVVAAKQALQAGEKNN